MGAAVNQPQDLGAASRDNVQPTLLLDEDLLAQQPGARAPERNHTLVFAYLEVDTETEGPAAVAHNDGDVEKVLNELARTRALTTERVVVDVIHVSEADVAATRGLVLKHAAYVHRG